MKYIVVFVIGCGVVWQLAFQLGASGRLSDEQFGLMLAIAFPICWVALMAVPTKRALGRIKAAEEKGRG